MCIILWRSIGKAVSHRSRHLNILTSQMPRSCVSFAAASVEKSASFIQSARVCVCCLSCCPPSSFRLRFDVLYLFFSLCFSLFFFHFCLTCGIFHSSFRVVSFRAYKKTMLKNARNVCIRRFDFDSDEPFFPFTKCTYCAVCARTIISIVPHLYHCIRSCKCMCTRWLLTRLDSALSLARARNSTVPIINCFPHLHSVLSVSEAPVEMLCVRPSPIQCTFSISFHLLYSLRPSLSLRFVWSLYFFGLFHFVHFVLWFGII